MKTQSNHLALLRLFSRKASNPGPPVLESLDTQIASMRREARRTTSSATRRRIRTQRHN